MLPLLIACACALLTRSTQECCPQSLPGCCPEVKVSVPNADPCTAALPRRLDLELLALDLATCTRCTSTASAIEAALADLAPIFAQVNVDVRFAKRVVRTAADAEKHRLTSSPTLRIQGVDVALELRESACGDCCEIAGTGGVDCRVWIWQGQEYTEPPKALFLDALLQGYARVLEPRNAKPSAAEPYEMPENLRRFFAARDDAEKTHGAKATTCCTPSAGTSGSCCGRVQR